MNYLMNYQGWSGWERGKAEEFSMMDPLSMDTHGHPWTPVTPQYMWKMDLLEVRSKK